MFPFGNHVIPGYLNTGIQNGGFIDPGSVFTYPTTFGTFRQENIPAGGGYSGYAYPTVSGSFVSAQHNTASLHVGPYNTKQFSLTRYFKAYTVYAANMLVFQETSPYAINSPSVASDQQNYRGLHEGKKSTEEDDGEEHLDPKDLHAFGGELSSTI